MYFTLTDTFQFGWLFVIVVIKVGIEATWVFNSVIAGFYIK